jgi:hypothetical protein
MNNVAVNVRPPGLDLFVRRGRRLDEAYKAFIMVTCALVYSVVLLGRWGVLKDAANLARLDWWLLYAFGFLGLNLVVVPGLYLAATALGRRWAKLEDTPLRSMFVDSAYSLVPLGLAAWIAFSLGLVMVNISYALPVLADPFGWGWNLLGLRDVPWTPVLPGLVPYLQVPLLLGGMALALYTAWRIIQERAQERTLQAFMPTGVFLTLATLGFVWLYLG